MRTALSTLLVLLAVPSIASAAAPPVPSGPHPRLFMSAAEIAGYSTKAADPASAAGGLVADCQNTIDNPQFYTDRGGADGDTWPGSAMACAFAYLTTKNAAYLTQAVKYWQAALNDDMTLGDGLGCVPGASTDWQTWAVNEDGARPPILVTVTHDTGYPMRWYGPDIALTYDWLSTAPGIDPGLLTQTQVCLTSWIDWYSQYGYHHEEAGSNYNAGFVIAKALGAIAIGSDGGADGHLWSEVVDDVFGKLLIGEGLAGKATGVGTPAGVLLGGDWGEGWQYGPLSVLEYAVAARALEEHGAALPEMDAWTNSLMVRYAYGTVPKMDGQWAGGDFDSTDIYQSPAANQLDAVLAGPSSDEAASWAAFYRKQQQPGGGGFFYNALAELRAAPPIDFRATTPAPPLWYLARGTRAMYARTAWDDSAYWSVFESAPQVNSDHHHMAASNFVFSRGGDHLVVDPSFYGCRSSLPTNAVTADSTNVTGSYAPSQTPWSEAELLWARASEASVYAARSDFAKAFNFADSPSDIPYAHREWVMLPEGEIVAIDRVRTGDAARTMYVDFHTNTGGSLGLAGPIAVGTVGSSQVAIHAVLLSGGTPTIQVPPMDDGNCYDGTCSGVRFAVDEYSVRVPGPYAVAIHAIDGLSAGEAPAEVGSINDDNFDPAPKQNAGVIGAAVYRGMKQSYVIASQAEDGAAGPTMTYGIPAMSASRHIVFDAPEASDGTSVVTASAEGDRCTITITAGSGAGFAGHPLMFGVEASSKACKVTEDTNVAPGTPPPGGGVTGAAASTGSSSSGGATTTSGSGATTTSSSGGITPMVPPDGDPAGTSKGCGCVAVGALPSNPIAAGMALLAAVLLERRRRDRFARSTRERGPRSR